MKLAYGIYTPTGNAFITFSYGKIGKPDGTLESYFDKYLRQYQFLRSYNNTYDPTTDKQVITIRVGN